MMVVCAATGCQNTTTKGYRLFKFPPNSKKHMCRRQLWAENSGRTDLRENGDYRLCQMHFDPELIIQSKNGLRLAPGAVPTRFSPLISKSTSMYALPYEVSLDHNYAKSNSRVVENKTNQIIKLQNKEIKKLNALVTKKNKQLNSAGIKIKRLNQRRTNLEIKFKQIFNKDMLVKLQTNTCKKWSIPTIRKCLQLKYACKNKGYEYLRKKIPFPCIPSIRTLQKRVENINFRPGLMKDVFNIMEAKICEMAENERLCTLL